MAAYSPTTVNRLRHIIKNPRLSFKSLYLEEPDYNVMISNPDVYIDPHVVEIYNKENRTYHFKINITNDKQDNMSYIACKIRSSLAATGYTETEISDMLVKYLYGKKNKNKEALWLCYGEYIVENLIRNKKYIEPRLVECIDCGEWFEVRRKDNNTCRCYICNAEHKRILARERKRRQRASK